jgi:hypothetical protein
MYALSDKYREDRHGSAWKDETDISSLIGRFQPIIPPLVDELAKFMLPSDVEEIRRIVAEIEDRIAKQSQRFGPAAP